MGRLIYLNLFYSKSSISPLWLVLRGLHWQLCGDHSPPLSRLLDGQKHYWKNHGRTKVRTTTIQTWTGYSQVVELCEWRGVKCVGVWEGRRRGGHEAEQGRGADLLDRPCGQPCHLGESCSNRRWNKKIKLSSFLSGFSFLYCPVPTGAPLGSSRNNRSTNLFK